MRVCVIGSGGREHALAHVLGRSAEVVVTPAVVQKQADIVPPVDVEDDVHAAAVEQAVEWPGAGLQALIAEVLSSPDKQDEADVSVSRAVFVVR